MKNSLLTSWKRVEAFEEAVREMAFIGTKDPEDAEEVEREYLRTKRELDSWISRLIEKGEKK